MKGAVKGKTRKPKAIDTQLRSILAENVRRRMEARYPGLRNQERKLAVEADVALSTLQRLLASESGATVDTISAIAKVFHTAPYKFLIKAEEQRFFIDAREIVTPPRDEIGRAHV